MTEAELLVLAMEGQISAIEYAAELAILEMGQSQQPTK